MLPDAAEPASAAAFSQADIATIIAEPSRMVQKSAIRCGYGYGISCSRNVQKAVDAD
jgi:hypothetical protein